MLFSQQPFSSELVLSNKKQFRYEWIWKKNNAVGFLNANRMPLRAHENILVFYDKLPTYNPQKAKGKPWYRAVSGNRESTNYGKYKSEWATANDGTRYPIDVISFSNAKKTGQHPTQKPVVLLEYLIKTYTNEGETVLDNCMGSGSTGVACINTNRNFIGIEKDDDFFNIAKERIENHKAEMGIGEREEKQDVFGVQQRIEIIP